jgi:hypothetical protein
LIVLPLSRCINNRPPAQRPELCRGGVAICFGWAAATEAVTGGTTGLVVGGARRSWSAFLLRIGAAWHADRGKRHDKKVKVEQPS